tara:strand:+ start:2116 stop:2310 length:195 start_codon:yes stop_codon:yes gene_type:complete
MKNIIFSFFKKFVFGPSDAQICEQQLKEYSRIENVKTIRFIKYTKRESLYRKIYRAMVSNRRTL